MKRRSDISFDPQALFRELCDFRLDWPGKTVRLERNSAVDWRHRSTSTNVSVAELYHENSKLYPNILEELAATRVGVDDFRQEFIRRRAALAARDSSEQDLDLPYRRLLDGVSRTIDPKLFYALELRVVAHDLLSSHEPSTNTLSAVKRLSPPDAARLRNALRSTDPQGPMLFLIGCFVRNAVLFGARGYRRTLWEAGQVTAGLLDEARRLGLRAVPAFEFTDRDVDAVVEADGTEEGTLVVFNLGEPTHVE